MRALPEGAVKRQVELHVRLVVCECCHGRQQLASEREEEGVLHIAQVRGVVVDVILQEMDQVRREGDAQLRDDAVLRAVHDLGHGAKEDEHIFTVPRCTAMKRP